MGALLAVAATVAVADPALSRPLLAAVTVLDPAAVPVERRDVDGGACRPRPAHPARVAGDFTGDGRVDYALYP